MVVPRAVQERMLEALKRFERRSVVVVDGEAWSICYDGWWCPVLLRGAEQVELDVADENAASLQFRNAYFDAVMTTALCHGGIAEVDAREVFDYGIANLSRWSVEVPS